MSPEEERREVFLRRVKQGDCDEILGTVLELYPLDPEMRCAVKNRLVIMQATGKFS